MIVALFRRFATFFLALMGSSEGSFTESNCVFAWRGLSARGFLVASDGSIYFGPESVRLGLPADGVLCLYTQDPVAHCLIRRCVFHSLSPCFNFVLLQTCRPCLRVSNLPWSSQRVILMFHGSLSVCDRNTGAHVNVSLSSVLKTCSMDSNRYSQVASTVP